MSSSTNTFEAVLSTLLKYLTFFLSYVLIAVRYFYTNYPETARVLTMVGAGYVLFKSLVRILKFWWGMLKFAIKVTFLFVIVVTAVCAYYRGAHRFFTKDIPFAYSFWQLLAEKQLESIQNNIRYADILANTGLDPMAIRKSAAGWISENSEQIDTIKNGAKHLASDNLEYLQKFAQRNNLQDLLNLGFGNNPPL